MLMAMTFFKVFFQKKTKIKFQIFLPKKNRTHFFDYIIRNKSSLTFFCACVLSHARVSLNSKLLLLLFLSFELMIDSNLFFFLSLRMKIAFHLGPARRKIFFSCKCCLYTDVVSFVFLFCVFVFVVFWFTFFSLSLKNHRHSIFSCFVCVCVFFPCNSLSFFESIIDKNDDRFVVVVQLFCCLSFDWQNSARKQQQQIVIQHTDKLMKQQQQKNRALKLSSSLSHNQVCTKKWIKFESKFQNSNPKRFEFWNYHWMCLVCVRCDMIWCPFCHCYWIFSCCYYRRRRRHQFINLSYMCVCESNSHFL